MTTIKVNNKTITIANKSNESFSDLDKESKSLESLALNIEKSIEALNIVSNIKAIESFGYKSTEGVGENIKNAAISVKNKIIEWFKKFIDWLKRIKNWVKDHLFKKKINNIKNQKSKAKMTTIAKDIEILSTKLNEESDKIVASIDGHAVEVVENEDTVTDAELKLKASQAAKENLDSITKFANKLADEELKFTESSMDEMNDTIKKAAENRQKAMDHLHKAFEDTMKDIQHFTDSITEDVINDFKKHNPKVYQDMLDILEG